MGNLKAGVPSPGSIRAMTDRVPGSTSMDSPTPKRRRGPLGQLHLDRPLDDANLAVPVLQGDDVEFRPQVHRRRRPRADRKPVRLGGGRAGAQPPDRQKTAVGRLDLEDGRSGRFTSAPL